MKSTKMTILIIIGIVAVVVIALAVYFLIPTGPKITAIKTYTAPDGSFSFQYPEFEGWKSDTSTDKDPWSVWFNAPFESVVAPRIQISVNSVPDGVTGVPPKNYTSFDHVVGEIYMASPTSLLVTIKIPIHENCGLSSKKMADMIIETFKFADAENNRAQAKRKAPEQVPSIVFDYKLKLVVPYGKMGILQAFDFLTGTKKWETKVYDVKYDESLEADVQDDYITDVVIEPEDLGGSSARIYRIFVVTENDREFEIDPATGSVKEERMPQLSKNNFLMDRRVAISLATTELNKQFTGGKRGGSPLELVRIDQIKDKPNQWFIVFDVSRGLDMRVEIILDVKEKKIINVQSSWS